LNGQSVSAAKAKALAMASSSLRSIRKINPYHKKKQREIGGAEQNQGAAATTADGNVGGSTDARDVHALPSGSQVPSTQSSEAGTTIKSSASSDNGKEASQRDLFDYHVKVLLLGDSGVGKTSLMTRFSEGAFNQNLMSTAGVDFKVRFLQDAERTQGKRIKCQIWDTAGQERFHVITRTYYRGSHGIALVYDVTNEQSFQQISYWMNNIKSHAGADVFVVLFGNKVDLPSEQRVVPYERGLAVAQEYGCLFYETSAKDGTNVLQAFEALSMNAVARIDASNNANAANGGAGHNGSGDASARRGAIDVDARSKGKCAIL